ncbi:hypothetical protein DERP_011586 [Dermatophagoides pteronyssinus]|uniref:Uncharacterized protein n=1 Tax=Dermatophagoides pteronyssinus TaxID=6956 RepID=A0ABQ8JWF0_DERPT|nr:hypothetical protein DERP_011586 [Dermatophagoides pteronyssinus]
MFIASETFYAKLTLAVEIVKTITFKMADFFPSSLLLSILSIIFFGCCYFEIEYKRIIKQQ